MGSAVIATRAFAPGSPSSGSKDRPVDVAAARLATLLTVEVTDPPDETEPPDDSVATRERGPGRQWDDGHATSEAHAHADRVAVDVDIVAKHGPEFATSFATTGARRPGSRGPLIMGPGDRRPRRMRQDP